MKQTENWVPVVGYEGVYEVSSSGNVRRAGKEATLVAMVCGMSNKGDRVRRPYRQVALSKNGRVKQFRVARIVASGFMRPPNSAARFVDHVNGDTLDDSVQNLRWVTPKDNLRGKVSKPPGCLSRFRGVSFDKSRNKWVAKITVDRITRNLGRFASEEEAATAFNNAAEKFGFLPEALNTL